MLGRNGGLESPSKKKATTSNISLGTSPLRPDDSFEAFQHLCDLVGSRPSHLDKTAAIRDYITNGPTGCGFSGDRYLVCKLLMCREPKRVYNMKDKQLVKALAELFGVSSDAMMVDLEQGDMAATAARFFQKSTTHITPATKSTLSLQQVV